MKNNYITIGVSLIMIFLFCSYDALSRDGGSYTGVNYPATTEVNIMHLNDGTIKTPEDPNLTPYQPSGWDDKLVLSNVPGSTTSSTAFYDNQPIYVDLAVMNLSSVDITSNFITSLYIDDVLKNTWSASALLANNYLPFTDYSVGALPAGSHTFKIVADADNTIAEAIETDNEYTRTITVTSSGCIPASLTTIFNGLRNINTEHYLIDSYRLKDNCQTATIHIQDYNSTTELTNPLEINSTTNSWTNTNQRFGGSVLWATKEAYFYFLNVHSRQSYDNAEGSIEGYINAYFYDENTDTYTPDNATMSSSGGILSVGLGNSGTLTNSYSALDIIAHEYTHAVTFSSAGLEYQDEPGALNESFSDIFGEVIENYVLGSNDWLCGSDRSSGPIRSMSDPKTYNQPDTYLSTGPGGYWYTGSNDYGGVHTNSGVQNYWFYLLAHGGSGTNDFGYSYSITGIGIDKASEIAFRNLTVILNGQSTANYEDAQLGSIQAAEELYGAGSTEANTVKSAWCAVGLGTCKPDLVVQNEQVSPSDVEAGSSATVSYYIKNQGDVKAVASTASLWFSQDQVLDGSPADTWLGDVAISLLNSDQTTDLISKQITIPSGTANGIWYIIIVADAMNNNNESDENNNTVNIPVSVVCNLPAPVVLAGGGISCSSATLTASGGSGGTIYWQGTVADGTSMATPSISQTVTSSGTYYFRAYNNCGWGPQGSATVTINTAPTSVTVSGDGTFCDNTSLTAIGGTGGIIYWQGTVDGGTSTATPSTSQTVTSSGTYYFRAYNSCGWGPQGSATVIINTAPSATMVSGDGTFCDNATLTASGGSGGTIYWQGTVDGGTSTATPSTSQTVTSSGTYYFRAYNSCGWGPQGSATVTVNYSSATPTSISASQNPVCSGNSTVLSVSGGSLGTDAAWIWYSGSCGGTLIGSGNSISVSPSSATIYFVRAEGACNITGCASLAINVNASSIAPSGASADPAVICSGSSSTLSVTGGSLGTGAEWYWYSGSCGGTLVGTGSSVSVLPATTTTYYVRAEGSCSPTACVNITVEVNPIPPVPSIVQDDPLYLTSSSNLGNQWYNLSGLISGATGQDYIPLTSDYYYVIVNINGCSSAPSNLIYFNSVGIESNNVFKGITLYPNPAHDYLIIENDNSKGPIDFVIINSFGRNIYKSILNYKKTIDLNKFSSGIYIIRFTKSENYYFLKFIKD
jgi:hypothetical protein